MLRKIMNPLRSGIRFLGEVYERKFLIYQMSKRDFKQRYITSLLGLFWAFFEPLAMMLIMWFVFSVGFRVAPSGSVPYVAYLFIGMVAFSFFENAVGASAGVIVSYSYLVQKIQFRVSILPIVKVCSALILHFVFVAIVIGIILASGVSASLFWFQALYYLVALGFLVLGLSWLLSAVGVFLRDTSHIVAILLRLGFWVSPIFWNIDMIPEEYQNWIKINPLFYIIQGYRESFLYGIPFWDHPMYTVYYWGVSTLVFVVGVIVFRRLRPHFADVL